MPIFVYATQIKCVPEGAEAVKKMEGGQVAANDIKENRIEQENRKISLHRIFVIETIFDRLTTSLTQVKTL